jgi:hypothetical protein
MTFLRGDDHGFSRFPVFYEVTEDTATVLAVAHQHRRPGYWRIR